MSNVPGAIAAPAPQSPDWFYEEGGTRHGPVSELALIGMIRAKQLGYGTPVWNKELPDWTKLADTSLRMHLQDTAPPPLPGSSVNNTLVWILAFAPLIGLFLEAMLAYAIHGNEYAAEKALESGRYFLVTVALNVMLSLFDEKRLKRAGHDTAKFRGWVWLVPVYLYQRARTLGQSLAYFIVWMICFGVVVVL